MQKWLVSNRTKQLITITIIDQHGISRDVRLQPARTTGDSAYTFRETIQVKNLADKNILRVEEVKETAEEVK